MPSTFFGLNIAASGMATYNAGLTTTGHNISNIKTEGYTRQSVKQQAKEAISLRTSYGMLGSGVIATDIVSARSDYYDTRYRQTNSIYGKYTTQSYYLKDIENYFYP
ncbi:MAG: flagellar hook-associated protein FlgK, partial [Eubacteriales bacterium]|nr:flagellar hook-associated protein FlgK [Eubacteriales bacterium]